MFRALVTIIAVVCFLFPPSSAQAGKGDILLTAFGGAGIPSGDFGEYWSTGLALGARADYLINPAMSVGLNLEYLKNDPSDMYKEQMETFGIDSAKFTTMWSGSACTTSRRSTR